jgi:large subunit ribosomal protein L46
MSNVHQVCLVVLSLAQTMAPRSRGLERVLASAGVSRRSLSLSIADRCAAPFGLTRPICRSCRQTIARRGYASAAVAEAPIEPPPVSQVTPDEPQADLATQPKFVVKAGVLLSRAPLITANPHPFEKAYYLYQRRLNERTVLPFTQYFYYKRGSPGFEHWRKKKAERSGTAGRDIGNYNAYKDDSWNDEVLVGDKTADADTTMKVLVEEEGRGTEFAAESGLEETAGLRRVTAADEAKDERSLERSLSRTLYLLVKENGRERKRDNWIFPSGALAEREGIAEVSALECGPWPSTLICTGRKKSP